MKWIELILSFLRNGFSSKVDMNALVFQTPGINISLALKEIDSLIQWNKDRKIWNERRLRAKMASAGESTTPQGGFSVGDFGLDEDEVLYLQADFSEGEDSDSEGPLKFTSETDDIEMERRRQSKEKNTGAGKDETSRSSEPVKPEVVEILKLVPVFVDVLRVDMSANVVTEEKLDKAVAEGKV
jgi:hypothetical protein